MDDWDVEDSPAASSGASTPAPAPASAAPKAPAARSRWQDEDKSDEEEDDWDVSDSEKPKKSAAAPAASSTAAPVKKKMTLKQKLAEKERLAAENKDNGEGEVIDALTEQDRRRIARERELESDLAAAADLMGGASVQDAGEALKAVVTAQPSTKADFTALSQQIMASIIAPHVSHPLYSAFVEQLSKDLCEGLTAVQTRKVSSALSVLGNTKQQEERDKASGKKKTTNKPKLAATKPTTKVDTEAYDDVLEDDDFM